MTETAQPAPSTRAPTQIWRRGVALPEARWAALALGLFLLGGLAQLADTPTAVWWGLYLLCYATGGWEQAISGLRALRAGSLDVDLLMVVAAIAAACIGQVLDGALLIVIFATSGALESFVTQRTEDSVRALLLLAPERATRLDECGETEVDARELRVGDLVLVRPGERIGADGLVSRGCSDVDQSSITGESLPVARQVGDEVFAGSLNGSGALTVRVSRPASDSVIARIVSLVEQASATKARTQLFIEKIEQRYSIVVVIVTLALFAVPLLLGQPFDQTLLRAMTFMIVASPCAVVLAIMPPLLAVIANAGRHGVLIKSAVVVEQLRLVDMVAFDKTGTLTQGTPRVAGIDLVPGCTYSTEQVLTWTAGAEQPSEHPIGRAVVAEARRRGLPVAAATEFSSRPGAGVRALVEGRRVAVGSPGLLTGTELSARVAALVEAAESIGRTTVLVVVDDQLVAVISVADAPRVGAGDAVADLTSLTNRSPVLLTGDNARAADQLGNNVGITDVRANLLPEHKLDHVRNMQRHGRKVALIGDGINDAPALAAADVGIAMGRYGSDLALESADAIIVRDELDTLPTIIVLARRAHNVVRANVVFAGVVIVGLVAWDILGTLPLPLGVAGHEGSTIAVGLNGLRLLRRSVWIAAHQRGSHVHNP